LGDIVIPTGGVPKLPPDVFAVDEESSGAARSELNQIGGVITALVKGHPHTGVWAELRVIASTCSTAGGDIALEGLLADVVSASLKLGAVQQGDEADEP
jgi:hypothetical protein